MDNCEVIATDLDGTLLDDRRLLSGRNREALIAAREQGIKVVAATARTPRGIKAVPGLEASIDAAICNNGAILYDPQSGAADVRHTITVDAARKLHRDLRRALPNASHAIETGTSVIVEGADLPTRPHYDDPWISVDALEGALEHLDGVVEYRILDRAMTGHSMLEAVRDITVPGVVRWAWGSYPVLEYNAEAVNKGDALAAWCAEQGIGPESVVAFGDMPNDVPMLAWAGRSYAVAGAQPEAVAAPDRQTASNGDDGVAQAVEAILDEFAHTTEPRA